jgi:hypothetical protein
MTVPDCTAPKITPELNCSMGNLDLHTLRS